MKNVALLEWLQANAQWLGYVAMALLGGGIAHIQAFEKATVKWSGPQHLGLLVICWTKAFFIAVIIYYLGQEYKWSQPLCFVATGVLSVFATDAIVSLYAFIRKRLLGQSDPPKPPTEP